MSRFRQKTTTPADVARLRTSREVRGGIIQGRPVSAEEIATLATLSSLDVLRGQVVGAIAAPLVTVVGLFDAPLRDLVGVLQARIDQLQAQGES